MLAKLVNGISINPELVKYIYIRRDRIALDGPPQSVFIVSLKLDDGVELPAQYCLSHEEAVIIADACTDKINKTLSGESDSSSSATDDLFGSDDSSSTDDSSITDDDSSTSLDDLWGDEPSSETAEAASSSDDSSSTSDDSSTSLDDLWGDESSSETAEASSSDDSTDTSTDTSTDDSASTTLDDDFWDT